jgi:hypothetical protein
MSKTEVRRSSSLSAALRAVSDLPPGPATHSGFRIRVATDTQTRRRAYSLAYDVYKQCGYVDQQQELIVSPFDTDPQTLTLLAEDSNGRAAGTASIVFDGDNGLPSDEIFGAELDVLRCQGRHLTEIMRLAVSREHQHSRDVLLRLFNLLFIFARKSRGADDCVIEINPRHVGFYQRVLLFQQLSTERACPRVSGAPAILMRLDYAQAEREIAQPRTRTLYAQFYRGSAEAEAASRLAVEHRPMTQTEAESFGMSLVASASR